MADQGNAGSWWRPYVGKYELTLGEGVTMADTTIMLSTILDVLFTSDMVVASESAVLATLPEECTPVDDTYFTVLASANEEMFLMALHVNANGEIAVYGRVSPTTKGSLTTEWAMPAGTTLHLNGTSFNICGKYYREEV